MLIQLIDRDGELWDAKSRMLRAAFDSPFSGGDFTAYAIRNLGFIGIYIYGSSCQLVMRYDAVSNNAIATLFNWVRQHQFDRYVLSSVDPDQNLSLFTRPDHLLRSIDELGKLIKSKAKPDYILQNIPAATVPEVRRLQELLTAHPIDFTNDSDLLQIRQFAEQAFGGRYVLANLKSDSNHLSFAQIGSELFRPYQEWRGCAIGGPVSNLPDQPYGRWVEASYFEALQTQAPLHQKIDAVVRWPHSGKARVRYERTILPVRSHHGLTGMISGTSINNSIDLRLESV